MPVTKLLKVQKQFLYVIKIKIPEYISMKNGVTKIGPVE